MASDSASKYDSKSAGEDRQLEIVEAHGLPISTSGNATTDPGSGAKFLQAIAGVRSAVEHAVQIGKTEMATADLLYYAGLKTRLDPAIVNAVGLLKQAEITLNRVGDIIGGKTRSAPIYKLPPEVMSLVFGHLDTDDLFTSETVCHYWKSILGCNASIQGIWRKGTATLHGTLQQMDAQWDRLLTKVDFDVLERLSIKIVKSSDYRKEFDVYCPLSNTKVYRQFPKQQLRDFRFVSEVAGSEGLAWSRVQLCSLLRVLHWTVKKRDRYDTRVFEYGISTFYDVVPPRLEEFRFDSGRAVINVGFVQMLCQVKRLHLLNGLSKDHVLAILHAARYHLEEISIAGIDSAPRTFSIGPQPEKPESGLTLVRLRSISIHGQDAGVFHIAGPNVVSVHFDHGDTIDRTLFDSCRYQLKSLHIETKGVKTGRTIIKERFDMPQLEELLLDYTVDTKDYRRKAVRCYRKHSTTAFWQIIKRNDAKALQAILPKLKKLKIVHDPLLNEEIILQFLEVRSRIGQPALEKVDIWLANHCSDDTSGLDRLQTTLPGFEFSRFDEWKTEETVRWYLKEAHFYGRKVGWNDLDSCRSVLKVLSINQGDWYFDRRLAIEPFDMPNLEVLVMDFGTFKEVDETRSCSALWKSYLTGTTIYANVHLRDILPRLNILKVRNDGTLNEEVIIRMMESRENLGMKHLETVYICAASKEFTDEAKLDYLGRIMPQIRYRVYEDWSRSTFSLHPYIYR